MGDERLPFGLLALPRDFKRREKPPAAAQKKDDFLMLSSGQKDAYEKMAKHFDGLHEVICDARALREARQVQQAEALFDAIIYFARKTSERGYFRNKMLNYEISSEKKLRGSADWLQRQPEWRSLIKFMAESKDDFAAAARREKAKQLADNPMDMYEEILFLTGHSESDKHASFEQLANFAKELPGKFSEHMGALLASDEPAVRETAMKFKESEAYKELDVILRSPKQQAQIQANPPKMKAF